MVPLGPDSSPSPNLLLRNTTSIHSAPVLSYTQAESMPPAWTALSESPLVHYRLLPAFQENYGSALPLGIDGTILLAPSHTI